MPFLESGGGCHFLRVVADAILESGGRCHFLRVVADAIS